MSNNPPQHGFGGWNLLRSFSEWATVSFLKKIFTSWITASVLFAFVFIYFFLWMELVLLKWLRTIVNWSAVAFSRLPTNIEVKYKFSAYSWREMYFGKLQDDPFLLKFRKHFSSWRWLTTNSNFYILINIPSLWTKRRNHNIIVTNLSTSNSQFKNHNSDGTHCSSFIFYLKHHFQSRTRRPLTVVVRIEHFLPSFSLSVMSTWITKR